MLVIDGKVISMVQLENCMTAIENDKSTTKFDESSLLVARGCLSLKEKCTNGFIKFTVNTENKSLYNMKSAQKGLRKIFLSGSGYFDTDAISFKVSFTNKQPKLKEGVLKGISFNTEMRRVREELIIDIKKQLDLAFFLYFVCPQTKVSNPTAFYKIVNDDAVKQSQNTTNKIGIKITTALTKYHTGDNYPAFVEIFNRTFGIQLPLNEEIAGTMQALGEISNAVKINDTVKLRKLYVAIEEHNSKENVILIKKYSSEILSLIENKRFAIEGGLTYIDNKPFGIISEASMGNNNTIATEIAINIIENDVIRNRYIAITEKKISVKKETKDSNNNDAEEEEVSYQQKLKIGRDRGLITLKVSKEAIDEILKKEIEGITMIPEGMSLNEAIRTYLEK